MNQFFNIIITRKKLKQFNILIAVIFLAIGLYSIYAATNNKFYFIISFLLLVFAYVYPYIMKPFYYIWMVFGSMVGWIMTRVIISLFFYTLVTPIALIGRLFGYQFIDRAWGNEAQTYWNFRDKNQNSQLTLLTVFNCQFIFFKNFSSN